MNVLMWFTRDLRLCDNAALSMAAARGAVLPVYIVEPQVWAQPDHAARHYGFLAESLEDLRRDLAEAGLPLVVRMGPAPEVLARLCARHAATEIFCQPGTGLAAWARAEGILLQEIETPLTGEPLPAPNLTPVKGVEATPLPPAKMLRLPEDRCPHRQTGGRAQALDLLQRFLTSRGESYLRAQADPLASERATSRLSPHLTHGALSLREVQSALAARLAEAPKGRWPAALASFHTRLTQRFTAIRSPVLAPQAGAITPALTAWEAGETGLPFLDACLRYLAATGWLNAHLRGLVLGAAVHHLGLGLPEAAMALARRLTDYDPALFWPEAEKCAGLHAAPRLLHPVRQGQELDPQGIFTRRWLPELAAVPAACLQEPWKWAGAARLLGQRYPEPLVDIATAHRDAREAIAARHGPRLRALPTSPMLIEPESQPRLDQSRSKQPRLGQLRLEF